MNAERENSEEEEETNCEKHLRNKTGFSIKLSSEARILISITAVDGFSSLGH
jgi:hypothetical protein